MVYSGINSVDSLRNLRFPAPAARFCRVRGYLNLDICCVAGVNSLRRGLRRASSLWEGASGAPGRFLIASKTLAIGLTACALSVIAARCQIPPFVTCGDIFPRSGGSRSSQGELLRSCRSALIKFPLGEQTERVEPILLSSLYIPPKKRYSFSRTNFPGRRPWISASCTTF